MVYRVDLTERAVRNLSRIYHTIHAADVDKARVWFNGLETAILSLDEHPGRGATTPENATLRHLLHGRRANVYRIIYSVDEENCTVTVLHIRHGARAAFSTEDLNDGK